MLHSGAKAFIGLFALVPPEEAGEGTETLWKEAELTLMRGGRYGGRHSHRDF